MSKPHVVYAEKLLTPADLVRMFADHPALKPNTHYVSGNIDVVAVRGHKAIRISTTFTEKL